MGPTGKLSAPALFYPKLSRCLKYSFYSFVCVIFGLNCFNYIFLFGFIFKMCFYYEYFNLLNTFNK